MSADERVEIARDYLRGARERDINFMPPSRMAAELAETRRQLGQILAAAAEEATAQRAALSPGQQDDASAARAFRAAGEEGRPALAAHLDTSAEVDGFYPVAYGAAVAHIDRLLGVIAELTGGAQ